MDDDQQFCLRWNNHQSTLISVFDTLLENETLVDCTLAAEGKFLKAHKVVLSACSPYFATLLQEQYDKHPIFILKDVKYQELRAMMDYMYRGEVNISQDQLAALLKAAESLQIKGLSDNRSGGSSGASQQPKPEHHRTSMPGKLSGGYTLEQTKRARITGAGGPVMDTPDMGSREGSSSPSRRRRKVRRRSIENAMTDVHDNSNSSQQPTQSNASGLGAITAAASALAAAAAVAPTTAAALASTVVPLSATQQSSSSAVTPAAPGTTLSSSKKTDNVKGSTQHQQQQQQQQDAMNTDNVQGPAASMASATPAMDTDATDASTADKSNHKQQKASKDTSSVTGSELVIEPKAEYDDEANDETVEDLTLDEEDMGMDDLDQNAGTSQGGEGSSQGYAAWQHDRSQDELLLATQEAQQRDPQDMSYRFSQSLMEDQAFSQNFNSNAIGNFTERFACAVCGKSYLRKRHLQRHMRDECIGIPPRFSCDLCPSRFRRKYHMVRHLTSKHGIPTAIAQLTTGNRSGGSSSSSSGLMMKKEGGGGGGGGVGDDVKNVCMLGDSECLSPMPENLTMRKEGGGDYKHEHLSATNLHLQQQHLNQLAGGGGGGSSPSHITSGDSGSDCNGGGTAGTSPIPPAHIMSMPTYGLTGAITAISAAAAHVEEKDAKILLEAAAAAAAAHAAATANAAASAAASSSSSSAITSATNNDNTDQQENAAAANTEGNENVANNTQLTQQPLAAACPAAPNGNDDDGDAMKEDMDTTAAAATIIKSEPLTPNKTAALNMLDDEWKMKLSLQLISNSLLKERLMNTMPFAYKNN